MSDLSREDAEALFNNVSKAVKDNDVTGLDALYKEEEPSETPEEEQPEEEEVSEEPESEDEESEDTPAESEESEEEDSPPPEDTKGADKAQKEKELTPAEKKLAEIQAELDRVKKDNHALRSQAGRVPHVQKRLSEMDKRLRELTSAAPSSQTSAKIKPKLDAILEGLKDTDPKLAETFVKAIEEATNTMDEENRAREIDNLKFARNQEATSYQQQEAERLLTMYPNAREVFSSPHWTKWKEKQSEAVVSLAMSANADDVDKAFKMYAQDMLSEYPDLAKGQEDAPAGKTPTSAPATEKAKKIEEERARKKEKAANVSSPTAAGKKSIPDDPEALFKKFSEQFAKERTR